MNKRPECECMPLVARTMHSWISELQLAELGGTLTLSMKRPADYHRLAHQLKITSRLPLFREMRQSLEFVPPHLVLKLFRYELPNPASTISYEFYQSHFVAADLHKLLQLTTLIKPSQVKGLTIIALGSLLDCGDKQVYPTLTTKRNRWVLDTACHWDSPIKNDFVYLMWKHAPKA